MNTSKMSAAQTAAVPLINKKLKKKGIVAKKKAGAPGQKNLAASTFQNLKAAGK